MAKTKETTGCRCLSSVLVEDARSIFGHVFLFLGAKYFFDDENRLGIL
jgi:hypothetical protein